MTFLISFPIMLSSTIGQKDLGVLYDSLLGLGMTTNVAILNWKGQNSYVMQVLVM